MLKKILLTLALIVLVGLAGVPAYLYGVYPKARPAPEMKAVATPEALARGKYLVESIGCVQCHSPVDRFKPGEFPIEAQRFAGRVFTPEEGFPGTIVAPNISPDPETGIGQWTDGEVARAIREGVSRDGRPLFPLMNYPGYRNFSDADTLAIIAYLRAQKPVRSHLDETKLDFPVNLVVRTMPEPLTETPKGLGAPGRARGETLLKVMLCGECHTPSEKGQPKPGLELAGGSPFRGPWGTVYAANITSHPSAGIGAYSNDDLVRVFREGKNRSGRPLWVMPWSATRNLSDEDLMSLIAALRQVAANPNMVPAPELKATN
jgi:mono/diheme cytochrome c family protein